MSFLVCSKLELASLDELRLIAKETTDVDVLEWLSHNDDPTVLENVAKNPSVNEKTIDTILNRLDEIIEKITKEDLDIPKGEVYPNYYVDFVESKAETYLTRICFACGLNPNISSETLHSLIVRPFKILVRSEKYYRLNTLLLKNPKLLRKSWEYLLDDITYISADIVKCVDDDAALSQIAIKLVTQYQKSSFLSQNEIHKILVEFGKNVKTSSETINLLLRFILFREYKKDEYKREKVEEELMAFAIHLNTSEESLDLLVLRNSEAITKIVEKHPNMTKEIQNKIEFLKQNKR